MRPFLKTAVQEVSLVEPRTKFWKWRIKTILIWRVLEVFGIGVAIWALWEAIGSNRLTLEALKETQRQTELAQQANLAGQGQLELARQEAERSRVINAWQILTTPARGNSGKKDAIETLVNAGIKLSGVDLSCKKMGGDWDPVSEECAGSVDLFELEASDGEQPAKLRGVDLSGANLGKASLKRADIALSQLSGVNFSEADLSGAYLTRSDLSNSGLYLTKLAAAVLDEADLSDALMYGADLSGARLKATVFKGAKLKGANLSNATFCDPYFKNCVIGMSIKQIHTTWVWEDRLPVFSMEPAGVAPGGQGLPQLCSTKLRSGYEATQKHGKPRGC